MRILGPHHLTLTVADCEASAALYKRLGFKVEAEDRSTRAGALVLRRDDLRLNLVASTPDEQPEPPAANDTGRWHIALRVSNIGGLYEELRAEGHEFISPPLRHESGLTWCFLRDPGGSAIELIEVP
jgi:catechol 2,3-dioxygenase-like lactoylglutathione lyase family enzyme